MTPSARIQAAIELLDDIVSAARNQGAPADRLLADWFKARRFAGSKDRRAIRELVYGAIRACGPVPESGRAAMLRLAEVDPQIAPLFDGSNYGPQPIADGEQPAAGGVAPGWLAERLAASDIAGEEAQALLDRAPLDIRVNTLKSDRAGLKLPVAAAPLPAPQGLRLPAGTQVEQWPEYREGLIEVQDGGSQLVCAALGAKAGETVIDLCAGAGGKTLALAAAMENKGTLIAADTDRTRLSRLGPRAERAGALVQGTVLLDPGKEEAALAQWQGKADLVLIDAPCSGSGTWRRNPEARWRLDEAGLARLTALQARLLRLGAGLVRPGGRLAYVTCSLLDEEGADQIESFHAENPGWAALPPACPLGRPRGAGWRLTPSHDETDGFFFALTGKA
ncbi:16S rRNA (cytosine967-C5)-methyltransferase [Altererythrobacter atlanticus]|uniref:Ribosomal RNA small subunit methyltransferase B n=1 Tax=Croceibacterium atlanticum TaxID=1267766 RepID=A0A0F7KLA8_9SPHN|nr:RsmB/NOP family class I SAM-dependent RNA methyltransferase [Croceibacterium atlanticum]AKH41343.1 Ribosomal RNA small subunit methyltransferase B [Croceibacterium atlanticum]MBB5734143.1 16S rRNA (cytosine967-C5)-methyltransferase [Croceibacterium atlanticum]